MSDDNSSLTYVFLHNWLDRSYSNQDLFKNPKMDPKPNQESGSGSSPEYSKYVMTPQKILQHLVFFS